MATTATVDEFIELMQQSHDASMQRLDEMGERLDELQDKLDALNYLIEMQAPGRRGIELRNGAARRVMVQHGREEHAV